MALMKIKLGELIRESSLKNEGEFLSLDAVRGISTQKAFIETHADMEGVPLHNYKVVNPNDFAYVADTSRRGDKISLAFNMSDEQYLVSSISTVFYVEKTDILNPLYLFMYFNRPEFDRYSRFNSWGSAREAFSWEDMCDIELELPDLATQQKYVDIYKGMVANQVAYEAGLEDLKLSCDATIEDFRNKYPCEPIGKYIYEINDRNKDLLNKNFKGICMDGVFIDPPRISISPETLKIVRHGDIVFNHAVECVTDRFIVAQRVGEDCVVSNSYIVFSSKDENRFLNDYLCIWLHRKEFARYSKFISFGTTHECFEFRDMQNVVMPIPPIEVQRSISNIYKVYVERKEINEQLKQQIKNLCPILIRGAVEEAARN